MTTPIMAPKPKPYTTVPSLSHTTFPGEHLALHQRLGHGTYGVVYAATCTRTRSPRAVKVLRWRGPAAAAEAALHALVNGHKGVVQLHGVFGWRGCSLLVMQRAGGGTMFEYMDRGRPYWRAEGRVRRHFGQVLEAVEWCHKQGVYHRDIKPQNILLSADARHVYLSDFGLATTTAQSTQWRCGTLAYMSPENLNELFRGWHRAYSPALSDTWALGVLLTNMLCHCTPWAAASPSDELFVAYLKRGTAYLRATLPVSRAATGVLAGLLAPRPCKRWTIMKALEEMRGAQRLFASEDEIATAPRVVQLVAEEAAGVVRDEEEEEWAGSMDIGDVRDDALDEVRGGASSSSAGGAVYRAWAAGAAAGEFDSRASPGTHSSEASTSSGGWWGSRGPLHVVNIAASSSSSGADLSQEDPLAPSASRGPRPRMASPDSAARDSASSASTPAASSARSTSTRESRPPVTPPSAPVLRAEADVSEMAGGALPAAASKNEGWREKRRSALRGWAHALWRRTGRA